MGSLLWKRTYNAIFATIVCLLSSPAGIPFSCPFGHALGVETNHVICNQVCEYDDWFDKAECDERNLDQVPLSTGCEETKILELQENRISHIDVLSLSGYRHLKTLDFSRNQIEAIEPNSFTNNSELTFLLITRNKLRVLHDNTFNGTEDHLTRIYLTRNQINNISDDAFRGLGQLSTLYLSQNLIKYLPETVFHDLIQIEYLYLSDNKISQIAPNAFKGLTNIRTITLDDNELSWLPNGLFDNLESLEELVLSNNALTVMLPPPSSLDQIEYQVLDLSGNEFSTSSSILPYLEIAERLYVGGNPFLCDCSFLKIQLWYQNKSESELEIYKYKRPITCDNKSISDRLNITCNTIGPSDGSLSIPPTSVLPQNTSMTTSSFVSSVSHSSEQYKGILTAISTEQNYAVNENAEISDCYLLQKKSFNTLVYCAVIMTVFFVMWLAKNIYALASKYTSNRAKETANVNCTLVLH